jgi:hypothetical protein
MEGRGRPADGPLDGDGRRSIYVEVRRNFLSPLMLAFDMPIPFSAMGARSVSNVPAQSLILMNDPLVIDQSQRWAQRLLSEYPDPQRRIVAAFESALGRGPTEVQRQRVDEFLDAQAARYGAGPGDLRVWADLCHTLFNMKQFIFLD